MEEATNEPVTTYTQQVQRVLDLAKEEALSLNHYYIGPEHLLLGILREGSAAAPLTVQGVTLARARAELLSMIGKDEPAPHADVLPLNPAAEQTLTMAGELARKHGETAISPEYLLQAVVSDKLGIPVQMLRSMEVDLSYWWAQEKKASPEENEHYIRYVEQRTAQDRQLDEEEERRLAHLVARGRSEQRRAELLKETPDPHLVEEGDAAYFELLPASRHLVLTAAKEYFGPERNAREIMDAGYGGLALAAVTFGLKRQTPFRAYARHMIHLSIINALR